jgi:hypothetical protein
MYSVETQHHNVKFPRAPSSSNETSSIYARRILFSRPFEFTISLNQARLGSSARPDSMVVVPYVADPNPPEPPANANDPAQYTRYIPIG